MSFIFLLSKLFTFLLLPPGIFIWIFLAAALFAKKFKSIFVLFAFVFWFLCTDIGAFILLLPLEERFSLDQKISEKIDAVVVLGSGVEEGDAACGIDSDGFKRVMRGFLLARKLNLPLVLAGGNARGKSWADAALGALEPFGASKADVRLVVGVGWGVVLENKSLDTFQNAINTYGIFERSGLTSPKIILVTSAYHMPRALALFEYAGFKPFPVAADFKAPSLKLDAWSLLPTAGNFLKSYAALHEYAGLLSLKMRGI